MRTRLQHRTTIVHAVLLSDDLVALVLSYVDGLIYRGNRVRRYFVPHLVLPRVCTSWRVAWRFLRCQLPRSEVYIHCPFLCVHENLRRMSEMEDMVAQFVRATNTLRESAHSSFELLNGQSTLLGHMIVHVAFAILVSSASRRLPLSLRCRVMIIRRWAAQCIVRDRAMYPRLPSWFSPWRTDPLHVALQAQ